MPSLNADLIFRNVQNMKRPFDHGLFRLDMGSHCKGSQPMDQIDDVLKEEIGGADEEVFVEAFYLIPVVYDGRASVNFSAIHSNRIINLSGDFESQKIRTHDRNIFLDGFRKRILCRFSTLDPNNSRMLLKGCHGDDILMHLSRDPEVDFFAVGHHVTEEIPCICVHDLGS